MPADTSPRSKLDHALEHARAGFPVFPLIENGKRPRIENWRNLATTDEQQIRKWWTEQPESNIGIATDQLVVIDVDWKKGGLDSLQLLGLTDELPPTRTSRTWSGGRHLVYRCPNHTHVKGGVDVLGKGLDLRAWGGLIAAPGSTIGGKSYTWHNSQPIADAPQWLLDRCKKPITRAENAGQRLVEEDDTAIARAEHWLLNHAPEATEGNRDDTAFRAAAKLYDFGISEDTCRELLSDWNFNKCHPALDTEAIERIARSAARNRSSPIGVDHPSAPGFEPVEIAERPKPATDTHPPKPKLYYVPFAEAAASALTTAAEPLIKGLLDRGAMSVWYGESNSGKTFILLDAAWHISLGKSYNGMRTRQGAVLYLAPEGGRGLYKRLAALRCANPDAPDDVPLYVVPCPVNLLRGDADIKPIIDMVTEIEAAKGLKVELIAVDTLSRALAGGDENSSVDMGALVRHFDALRAATTAHLAIVHHTGKDRARGARGHSLLRAATDTEIEIADRTVTVTKQRDLDGDKTWHFKLVPVRLGMDADGDPVTSCIVEAGAGASEPAPLAGEELVFAEAIIAGVASRGNARGDGKIVGSAFRTQEAIRWWEEYCLGDARGQSRSGKALRNEVGRLLLSLLKNAHIEKRQQGQWVIKFAQNAQECPK